MNETIGLVIVPLVIALLPLLWKLTAYLIQRQQLRSLILREIEEAGPLPEKRQAGTQKSWTGHHSAKRFIHQEILADSTGSRDFILSLPPSLVYHVVQLWQSEESADQWLYMLWAIREEVPFWMTLQRAKLGEVVIKWFDLIRSYDIEIDEQHEQRIRKIREELESQKASNRAENAG